MTGGDTGYQLGAAAIRRRGYETWVANTSNLSPHAPEPVIAATRELVARLFSGEAGDK
jgi:hypothetical protein